MPKKHLTAAFVEKVRGPTDKAQEDYFDTVLPAFGVRVGKTHASYFVMLRVLKAGKWVLTRITLGTTAELSLAEAREQARKAVERAQQGKAPGDVRAERREAQKAESRNTFAAVRDEFLGKYRGRQNRRPAPRTLAEIKRVLESDLFADWQDRPLVQVSRRDVLDALDVLTERGAEVMANRTLAYLRMLFGWAMHRGIVTEDPTDKIKKPGAETSRARVLSRDELRDIWHATAPTQANHGDLFEGIVKVLILTGQRRDEVAGMRWSEIDGSSWNIPGERTKNHRDHIVPLSPPVLAILEARKAEQTAMGMQTDYVFTSFGPRPFSGWSKSKARLDGRAGIAPWTIHDLRRTLATRMAEDLRIPPHVIEAVVNHVSGTRAGVAGTYNRAIYLDERKGALDAWADYVRRLVGETEAGNIAELASKVRRSR